MRPLVPLLLFLAGCTASDPGTPVPPPVAFPPMEQVLLDQPFKLAANAPASLQFTLPSDASASVLRVVLDTGAPLRLVLHGPGPCQEFDVVGPGVGSSILLKSGRGMEKACGSLASGQYGISWEGEGYVEGRLLFRASM